MIARSPVAIDVDDQPPSVPEGILCDCRVFRFLAPRLAFLRVIKDGMCEFASCMYILWFPDDGRCVVIIFIVRVIGPLLIAAVVVVVVVGNIVAVRVGCAARQ